MFTILSNAAREGINEKCRQGFFGKVQPYDGWQVGDIVEVRLADGTWAGLYIVETMLTAHDARSDVERCPQQYRITKKS